MTRAFTVIDAPQRSAEWFAARAGRLTGSVAKDMLATIKTGEAAARRDLRLKLMTERLTGQPQEDGYVNEAMQYGIDCEPLAFAAYEGLTGHIAERTGFLAHDALMAGCSLDGHVGEFEGILELKCPKSATHLRYLRAGTVPSDHLAQITHNLWMTGAAWCDFVSFDDRFPVGLQVFRVRVCASDVNLVTYEATVRAFLADVETEIAHVRAMLPQVEAVL